MKNNTLDNKDGRVGAPIRESRRTRRHTFLCFVMLFFSGPLLAEEGAVPDAPDAIGGVVRIC